MPRIINRLESMQSDRINVRLLPVDKELEKKKNHPDGFLIGRFEVVVETGTPGEVNAAVQIHLSGAKREPDILPITGKVASPFQMSPSLIAFPRQSGNGPIYEAGCLCRSTNGRPLALALLSVPAGLTAEILASGEKDQRTIRVKWDPLKELMAGQKKQLIRFRATVGEYETVVELPVFLSK